MVKSRRGGGGRREEGEGREQMREKEGGREGREKEGKARRYKSIFREDYSTMGKATGAG
jgi:hypothetical protein